MLGKHKPANSERTQAEPAAQPNGLPLFFSKPQVITKERHANAKLRTDITMAFAAGTNSIPITVADIPEAAKHYPIAFTQGENIIPVAIVGLEKNNSFIDEKGNWREGLYVPSYVRKYPFVFVETPESDQLTLSIDEDTISLNGKGEGPGIYEGDEPSAFTKSALEFCAAYQQQHMLTIDFVKLLQKKNLLSPQRSDVELASGRKIQLAGFQLLDQEKFQALSEADIYDWHKRGVLALCYYMFQSVSNWRHLLDAANRLEGDAPKAKAKR